MRKVISNTCDWLGEILAEVSDDERQKPGRPPKITVEDAPRWLVFFNWILLGFVLGLAFSAFVAQVYMWAVRP